MRSPGRVTMKTYMKMLATVAVAAIMCICPAIVMADGSDAYTKTDGDQGLSVKFSTTDTAQIARFYSEYEMKDVAEDALNSFSYSSYGWTITDIAVTSLSYEKGSAQKLSGLDGYEYVGETVKLKMTFTATLGSVRTLFDDWEPYILVVKAVDNENTGAVGDKFEVSVEATLKESTKVTAEYVETDAKDFFIKQTEYDGYNSAEYVIDAKFIKASDSTETKFQVDYKMENGGTTENKMDLDGVEEGAVTADTVLYGVNTVSERYALTLKCTVGDDSKSADFGEQYSDLQKLSVAKDVLNGEDLKLPTMCYVDGGDEVLMTGIDFGDATLETEDGFKSFLSGVGATTSTSYSDAKSISDDAYSTIVTAEDEALGLFAIAAGGLGILVIVLIIVIVIILIVKRKKR